MVAKTYETESQALVKFVEQYHEDFGHDIKMTILSAKFAKGVQKFMLFRDFIEQMVSEELILVFRTEKGTQLVRSFPRIDPKAIEKQKKIDAFYAAMEPEQAKAYKNKLWEQIKSGTYEDPFKDL